IISLIAKNINNIFGVLQLKGYGYIFPGKIMHRYSHSFIRCYSMSENGFITGVKYLVIPPAKLAEFFPEINHSGHPVQERIRIQVLIIYIHFFIAEISF